jgi:hypothetical protein
MTLVMAHEERSCYNMSTLSSHTADITRPRYHLLRGSASNVVKTGRSVNGNRPKLTPCRSETLKPIKTKLLTFGGTPHRMKFIISRSQGQHISFVLAFYFVRYLSQRPAKTAWPISRSIHQTMRSRASMCLSGVLTLSKTSKGFIFPKYPPKIQN